jgi:hypothetical protein
MCLYIRYVIFYMYIYYIFPLLDLCVLGSCRGMVVVEFLDYFLDITALGPNLVTNTRLCVCVFLWLCEWWGWKGILKRFMH